MESFYQDYKDQGLSIILLNFETSSGSSSYNALLNHCCDEKDDYNMTFTTAFDTGSTIESYFNYYIPTNLVLDDEMVIRYKVEDYSSYGIRNIVEQLLSE
jgi:hypothetical protein